MGRCWIAGFISEYAGFDIPIGPFPTAFLLATGDRRASGFVTWSKKKKVKGFVKFCHILVLVKSKQELSLYVFGERLKVLIEHLLGKEKTR